jgi:hypothetical protein
MKATPHGGWLQAPYTGPEPAIVEMLVGATWYPCFLDYGPRGERVVMIRPPAPIPAAGIEVKLRAFGVEYQ